MAPWPFMQGLGSCSGVSRMLNRHRSQANSPRRPWLCQRHAGASVSAVKAKTHPKGGKRTHISEHLDWQCMCILAEHLPGLLQPSAAESQRYVWGRGGSREGPGMRRHGAGTCPLQLWFPPSQGSTGQMGKRLRIGEDKTKARKPRAGGLPGCTSAVPCSTAPGRAARLLAHTSSMTTPSWAPGVNQAYTGSICSSGVTGGIHISSIHPSIQVLFPFHLM